MAENVQPLSTFIFRLDDGLPLVSTSGCATFAAKAKMVVGNLTKNPNRSPNQTIVDADCHIFVKIESSVIYMAFAEKGFPGNLAHHYLTDVANQFQLNHGRDVDNAQRAYACIRFETTLQRTRGDFNSKRSGSEGMDRLVETVGKTKEVLKANIEDIIVRAEDLNALQAEARGVANQASKYKNNAQSINRWHKIKTYGPVVAVVLIVLLLLWWRFFA